eukprot:CAMPEP_0116073142 /NCGR_PEP_ID=MMETSP0322-20121206/15022_1 /TAXON_ID=163516 /ORGANISM="Leptocylindrus danicus var. apora, Strain B651" /LENGTH=285 /DNA_ID=CAMNT_0003562271 /DNA_START=127 /DNA_END=981 /DNA_ORIENTATION=-
MISLFLVILVAVVVIADEKSLPNYDNNEGATVTHRVSTGSKKLKSTNSSSTTVTPRIVGGTDAGGHIDYQVLLLLFGVGQCGGNLIAPNVVLSAAHCQAADVSDYIVYTGLYKYNDIDLNPLPDPILKRSVVEEIVHPDFGGEDVPHNDVLLLRLDEPVDNMQPIALHRDASSLTVGQSLRTSGWGTTSFGGNISSSLLFADVNIVSNIDCYNVYNWLGWTVADSEICAIEDGKDSCQGDSGGPLVYLDSSIGEPLLVGVVSYGYGCASPFWPGVYARVSSFYSW